MPSRDGRRQTTPTSSSLTQLPKLNREALMGKTVELVRTRTPDLAAARRSEPEVLELEPQLRRLEKIASMLTGNFSDGCSERFFSSTPIFNM